MSINLYDRRGKGGLPPVDINPRFHDPALYFPDQGLINAVNVALGINQPLLVTGEPGSGKTQLAYHLAHRFELGTPFVFNTQTDSIVRDLFYWYDTLGHLQYAQSQREFLNPEEVEQRFIRYQALGAAIRLDRRCVVLIDEIDKAPRDLSNNILAALESMEFQVSEIGKTYRAAPENYPVVIFTSNSERNLPDAFLRRLVFYHIPFPSDESLMEILAARVDGFSGDEMKLMITHFSSLRDSRTIKIAKPPGVAELLNWAIILKKMAFPIYKLEDTRSLDAGEMRLLRSSYSLLIKNARDLAAINQLTFNLTQR